jgi:hypothetical protein
MKIKYNENEHVIEVNDDTKTHYFLMKTIMILNLANSILRLLDLKKNGMGILELFWLILGITSLVALYFYFYKNSTLEKIPIESIKQLKEKKILGRNSYAIELISGKNRVLRELKTPEEYKELQKLFSEIGIRN